MPSTLQRRHRKHLNNRRKYEGIGSDIMAETKRRKFKIDWFCKQLSIGHREKVRTKQTGTISRSMGTGMFSFIHIWKTN